MQNGTERTIAPHDYVRVRVNTGKATRYNGRDYAAGETLVMQKYEADAHVAAGIATFVAIVDGYDPTRIEPVELNVAPPAGD